MPIIVEDGNALSSSISYVTVSDADAYFSERGNEAWADYTSAQKEELLIKSADYIDQVYGLSFQGYRRSSTQSMAFPRTDVLLHGYYLSSTEIPRELKKAQIELAYKAAQGDLSPDLEAQVKREKIDVLEVEYMEGSTQVKRFRTIDNLLAPLLGNTPSGASRKLVRC
jgi:hypothetical protein